MPSRDPQPSRQAVQDALLALPPNAPLAAIQGFWQAYIDTDCRIPANRASALGSHLNAILRALGRYHDDEAKWLIEQKFGDREALLMALAELFDQVRAIAVVRPTAEAS